MQRLGPANVQTTIDQYGHSDSLFQGRFEMVPGVDYSISPGMP
jgi:hypothetical protein